MATEKVKTYTISLNISKENRIIGTHTELTNILSALQKYDELIRKELAHRIIESEKRSASSKNIEWKGDMPANDVKPPSIKPPNKSSTKKSKKKCQTDDGEKCKKVSEKLTVKTMKHILDANNISYTSSMKKIDIFEIIKANCLIRKAEKYQDEAA